MRALIPFAALFAWWGFVHLRGQAWEVKPMRAVLLNDLAWHAVADAGVRMNDMGEWCFDEFPEHNQTCGPKGGILAWRK